MPTCPYCYERFDAKDMPFRCENDVVVKCPKEDDPELAGYFHEPSRSMSKVFKGIHKGGWFGDKIASEGNCTHCHARSTTKLCPHCHNHLPPLLWESESYIISVIGARGSGKSSFITVLIDKLLKEGYQIGISAIPQNMSVDMDHVTQKRYERDYRGPLLVQGLELPQTNKVKDHHPLIYQITSTKKQWLKKKVIYLAFYDTAGENLTDPVAIKSLVSYLQASAGIILLLDTLDFPRVQEGLNGGRGGRRIEKIDANLDVLQFAIGHFQNFGGKLTRKRKTTIPMAIALNKFDEALRCVTLESPALRHIEQHWDQQRYQYDRKEVEQLSEVTKTCVIDWEGRQLDFQLAQHVKTYHYFPVSALGASPVNGRLQNNTARPVNVWTPLLWILDEIGFSLPKGS
jgi:GTPase SAR1 family protein